MRACVIFVAVLLLAGVSGAAASEPTPRWSGFYVGGSLGYSFADVTVDDFASVSGNQVSFNRAVEFSSFEPDGLSGGFHAGYNVQFGNLVFGGEASVSFLDGDTSRLPTNFDPTNNALDDRLFVELGTLAQLSLRGGIVTSGALIYAKVGAAWASVETRGLDEFGTLIEVTSDKTWHTGFVLGGVGP
jgi:outer membrane immunogenic protein